jgi:sigma-B regulation protein RsbU (phosphoserine phosphatase)
MVGPRRISIKTKLFIVITLIPTMALTLFLNESLRIFRDDKIAYVWDSSVSFSRTKAMQVRSDLQALQTVLNTLILNLQADRRSLSRAGQAQFENDSRVVGFEIWSQRNSKSAPSRLASRYKIPLQGLNAPAFNVKAKSSGALTSIESIRANGQLYFGLSSTISVPNSEERFATRLLVRAEDLSKSFNESSAHSSFLVTEKGDVLLAPVEYRESESDFKVSRIARGLSQKNLELRAPDSGTLEWNSDTGVAYLTSYAELGLGNLFIVSAVEKQVAMSATELLIKRAALFFLVLLILTMTLSLFASRRFINALDALFKGTERVARGEFNLRVVVKSEDEIGDLAQSFNTMSDEVARLINETRLKARMEAELQTARTVQAMLFPASNARLGPIELTGYYEPASECGGDWWHYTENEKYVTVFIGDATGHGVPAALLTSAAHTACVLADRFTDLSPAGYMAVINEALYEASKGQMMMTGFVARIEKSTGRLTYSIASHEAPLLVQGAESAIDAKNFKTLDEANNRRLGESKAGEFREASVQLAEGDRIFFYTDGVYDITSQEGKELGGRRMTKFLASALSEVNETEPALAALIKKIEGWRAGTPLKDDVTAILLKFHGASSVSSKVDPDAA